MTQPLDRRLVTEEKANATYGLKTDVEEKLDQASADALYAPVSLTSRLPRLRNTLVVAGDSNIENGGGPGRTNSFRPGAAWTWAQLLSGHRLEVVRNAGVGGETSTQLLARYNADVIAYNPGCVLINIGTNDAGIDSVPVPLATTKANILEMLDRNAAIGAKTIICTIPPRNTRVTATRSHALPLNAWIRSLPRTRDGVIVFDQYLYLQDPAVPDNWLSGYTGDGTHFKPVGGLAAGKVLAELIKREFPPLSRVSMVRGDETNLITNQGQFVGAAAGVAPTGWTLSNAGTMAPYITGLVPRTDGVPGNWLEIVVPTGANFVMSRAITSQVTAGDTIQAAVEFEFSNLEAAPSVYQYASLDLSIGPSYFNTQAMGHSQGSDDNHGSAARSGVLLTPPRTIQSGDTPIQAIFDIRGGGTYRFANATISKI
ncbi:SGNH/GDSL hydrolase family protein [Rhodococcus sp. LW-XY12]|uniref:SGNH/GDSL hydrolase family protein n=1 Tax=Rhodococcus sp. LW-XY12 TaxID=2856851 RepID=UPI001C57DADD|nr:SGNH/GDSL hydrolase family protein [Rhodococcus sp. LW-XY12]QXU55192.1 SGNH/GDSL hydrolase family protein [Rhodococcus sp. LW-XY12]